MASQPTEIILLALFFFAFIENVFPPSPSDVVVVFGAALITTGDGGVKFIPVLLITSVGSSLGFMLMYFLGKYFGDKVVRSGKLKFISPDAVKKADNWLNKYGPKLILANRFMPGTRSIISFASGAGKINPIKSFFYASISAFLWNIFIIYLGMTVGNNITLFDYYLNTYSAIIFILTLVAVLIFAIRYIIKKRGATK